MQEEKEKKEKESTPNCCSIPSDKAPKIKCFICGGKLTKKTAQENYEKLKADHETKQKEIKRTREEEKRKERENRKRSRKSFSSSDDENRPPTKKEIERHLKNKAKQMARDDGPKPEEVSLIDPQIFADKKKKIRMKGKCPVCSQQVNSYVKKEKIPQDVLDILKISSSSAEEETKQPEKKKKKKKKVEKKKESSSEESSSSEEELAPSPKKQKKTSSSSSSQKEPIIEEEELSDLSNVESFWKEENYYFFSSGQ